MKEFNLHGVQSTLKKRLITANTTKCLKFMKSHTAPKITPYGSVMQTIENENSKKETEKMVTTQLIVERMEGLTNPKHV